MSENTKIEWAHHTFNAWSGCAKVSPGCSNCYAANMPPSMRRGAEWGAGRDRIPASESYWRQPLAWDAKAKEAGERHRVFCASMADVFEARSDLDPWRERLFNLIVATPNLDWLLLTKRPEHAATWWEAREDEARRNGAEAWWPGNAWIGTSVENQEQAELRIPHLKRIPARVRFLSCEPLLGPLSLLVAAFDGSGSFSAMEGIHWVIVGGESGRGANVRPIHPDWVREIRRDCKQSGVAFHFKQWGEWAPAPSATVLTHLLTHSGELFTLDAALRAGIEDGVLVGRPGKHTAGRLLDGVTHNGFPGCIAPLGDDTGDLGDLP